MGKTTIEINGKQYDARSGALLGEGTKPALPKQPHKNMKHQSRVVDGFIKPSQADNRSIQRSSNKKIDLKQAVATVPTKAKLVKKRSDATIKPVAAHKPERAQTLMRKTVKKPSFAMKKAIKAQAPAELAAQTQTALPSLKLSAKSVDTHRLARAQSVDKSQRIKRFVMPKATAISPTLGTSARTNTTSPSLSRASSSQQRQPAVRSNMRADVQNVRAGRQTPKPHADIFEAAIANARSHEQPAFKPAIKLRSRVFRLSAAFVLLVALVGFAVYANRSSIELRIASMQAGFHAQLPAYQPVGYALNGGIHVADGIVSFIFRSGDSNFAVEQQSSNWDSQTLLDNVVAIASASHQTYQRNGRTVYIYGKNATWVSGGVLYNMKVAADLSREQIVNVASSM